MADYDTYIIDKFAKQFINNKLILCVREWYTIPYVQL